MSAIKGFGNRLKDCIKRSSYTQKEISEILRINQDTLSNYVKERSFPKADVLYALCKLLNISPNWLLTGESIVPSEAKKLKDENTTYTIENYTINDKPDDPSSIFNLEKKPLLKQIWETFVTLIKEESNVNMDKNNIGVIAIKNDFPELYKEIKAIKELGAIDNIHIKEIVELLKELPPSELKEIKNYVNYRLQSYNEMNKGGRSSTFTHGEETATLDDATA